MPPNETTTTTEQMNQGKIIGEGNNSYRNQGLVFDDQNNYFVFEKTNDNFYLNPGTPVQFAVSKDTATVNAKKVKPRYKNEILFDGKEYHPLIQIFNDISRILLEDIHQSGGKITPEDNTEILKGVLKKLQNTKIDDFVLKHWYDQAKKEYLDH